MGHVALVVGTALTLVTGWCAASLVESILEKVLTTVIVAVTQVVVTLLFAGGVLQSFAADTILGVNAVVTAVAVVVVARATSIRDRARGSWGAVLRMRPGGDLLGTAWAWVLGGGEDHALVATFSGTPPQGWRVIGTVIDGPPRVLVDGDEWHGSPGWQSFD